VGPYGEATDGTGMPLIDDDRSGVALPVGAEAGPNASGEPVLVVEGLVKRWPGREAPTLDGLDLRMAAGEVVALSGRNGAGKTTLLRVLGGLLAPDRGSVELAGLPLGRARRAYQRQIGLLTPGDRGLYARLTVARHLDLWGRLAMLDGPDRDAAIAAVTEQFDLEAIGEMRVDRLSMGQRQRVRLALAFLHAPRLVLLDEPATSLDSVALELLRRAVDAAAARGGMCLAVGPDGVETGVPAHRRLVLRHGRLETA
jgi:ABC-2 type transport system ATP-binding protein